MRYLKYVFFSWALHDATAMGYEKDYPIVYRFFRMKMNKYKYKCKIKRN